MAIRLVTLAVVRFLSITLLLSSASTEHTTRATTVEEVCYDPLSILCNNYTNMYSDRSCEPQTFTSISTLGQDFFIYFGGNFSLNDLLTTATFTSFSLCHDEALMLNINHLQNGQMCHVSRIEEITNVIKLQCNPTFPLMLNNLTIIMFELKNSAANTTDCKNMTMYKFAIVDITGMLMHVYNSSYLFVQFKSLFVKL